MGQEEILCIFSVTLAVVYTVCKKTISSSSHPMVNSLGEYSTNTSFYFKALLNKNSKDEVVKKKQITQIYQSGKLEENKLTFSAQLNAFPLVLGERWVVIKDVILCTPEEILIKKG